MLEAGGEGVRQDGCQEGCQPEDDELDGEHLEDDGRVSKEEIFLFGEILEIPGE